MTDDEAVLRTIRMIGFGELSRTSEKEWWCYVYAVTNSGRQERHTGNGDTAAQACLRAVASLERASERREM
jgi:hypothetical protein